MATIYKRRELRPIPNGAEIVMYRGKRYAKWTDAKGNARRAQLNEGGTRIIREAAYYTIQYFDHMGQRLKVPTKCADKDSAQQLANELEARAMKRREGLIDPAAERIATEGRRMIAEHVNDYLDALSAKGNTAKHVEMTGARVRFVIQHCGAIHAHRLQPSIVQSAIKAIRDSGRSLETCNSYLRAIKGFSRWLWRDKRTPDDSLSTLEAFNTATDRRHVRRELTPEELTYLLRFVETYTTDNHNMPGADRVMLYRLALGTGFRANELRTLKPGSFDLHGVPPTVTVAAAYSKRRRQDVQPIRSDLAELLSDWLSDRPRDERIFPRMPRCMSRSFAKDLAAARAAWIAEAKTDKERQGREDTDFLKYQDGDGRYADFHATRHTYISGVVATGCSIKSAQELARHSTPVLTIGRYSHARLHDLTGALDAMPDLRPREQDLQVQRATGTDDEPIFRGGNCEGSKSAKRGKTEVERGNSDAGDGICNTQESCETGNSQPVILSAVGIKKATSGETWQKAEGTGLSKGLCPTLSGHASCDRKFPKQLGLAIAHLRSVGVTYSQEVSR